MGKLMGLVIVVVGLLMLTSESEMVQLAGVGAIILGLLLAWKAEAKPKA